MPSIDQLLSRVVERKGFTIQGADQEALFARKGEESLLAAWKLDGPVTAADAQLFLTALDQVRATSGILLAPRGVDPAAQNLVSGAPRVDVWAESRLVHEVGEALVRDALDAAHPAAAAPAVARLPTSTPAPAANIPSGHNAFQATREVAAGNKPTSKFPSLVAQAASASVVSNAGAAYVMPNKPRSAPPADMQATIPQKGSTLGYAWGGGAGGPVNSGIAQIRSGRNPKNGLQEGGTVGARPTTAAAAPASNYIVPSDDVEIVSTPRRGARGAAAAAPAAMEQPAPVRTPAPVETEAYEILSSSKKPPANAAAAATAKVTSGPGTTGCLKLNVTKDDAIARANAKPGSNARLALVPHVTFAFDLHMERQGLPAPIEARGALLINSLNGELRTVDSLDYEAGFPADARKDQEKLQAVDVYDKVKSHMSKTYGRTMNVEREVAGNVVSSTMKIVPDPEEMGLEHKGIQYVPFWEISTTTGVVKVDGYTGQILGA